MFGELEPSPSQPASNLLTRRPAKDLRQRIVRAPHPGVKLRLNHDRLATVAPWITQSIIQLCFKFERWHLRTTPLMIEEKQRMGVGCPLKREYLWSGSTNTCVPPRMLNNREINGPLNTKGRCVFQHSTSAWNRSSR